MGSNYQVTTKKIKITAKQHTFDINQSTSINHSTSINPLIPRKFGPKNEIYSQCCKFGSQSRSSSLIINIFEIADPDLKLKTWGDLVSKLQWAWPLWNLALRTNRTYICNRTHTNIFTGIDDLELKLQICKICSQNWNFFQFLRNLAVTTNRTS